MFSIIIPTLNEELFLPHLLDSLVAQSQKNFEVIIVDGASKDKTVEVARLYKEKLPSLTVVMSNIASLPLQRNVGAKKAKEQWLLFVDADTVFLPYCLERLQTFTQDSKAKLITAWGKPDSEKVQESMHTLVFNLFLEASIMFKRQLAPGPFALVDRKIFARIDGYDETLRFGEDQNLSQRLGDMGIDLVIIRETLYVWSQRRFRSFGLLRSFQIYLKAGLRVLFTKKNYRYIPEYIMGGHMYTSKKSVRKSLFRSFELKLRKLIQELFE